MNRFRTLSARRRKQLIHIAITTVFAVIFAVIFLTPIVLTITNSLMSQTEINANYGAIFAKSEKGGKVFISEKVNLKYIPDMISFSQYVTVLLKSPKYLIKFWNSVILVLPILVFQLAVAVFASYGFMRAKGKLKEIVFFSYIILMLMPYQVTLVPNYLVSSWFHILDTRWAIWLPGIASPFAVYLITKFMRRIPNSFIEAAQIDGAGEWQIFTKIAFPLCKTCLFSVAILVFIDYWNMVEQPLVLLTEVDKQPLSVFLSQINEAEIGIAFAASALYMIPPLLIFLWGEEYLVEGISRSGVK